MKTNIISQHNNLINAKYKLSLNEKRLILCVLSKINPKEDIKNGLSVKLNIKDIFELFDCNKENYTYFIDLARNLRKKEFPMKSLTGKKVTVGWFSYAEIEDSGVLSLDVHKTVAPFLVDLKDQYTKYKLDNVINFKNVHTFRIYELCKQYQKFKSRKIEIKELKEILGIEDKYKRMLDFRKHVLNKAVEEINSHADININYELIKEGRAYKNIKFTIESKKRIAIEEVKKEKEIEIDPTQKIKVDTLKAMFPEKITEHDIKSILHIANWNLPKVLEKFMLIKDKPNITNFVGLMIKAIKENYDEVSITQETKQNVKTKFHNFDQRTSDYTPEELERKLLEKQKKKYSE